MSSKWLKFNVDPTKESLLKYRLKMLGMALKKLYRNTLKAHYHQTWALLKQKHTHTCARAIVQRLFWPLNHFDH